MLQRPTISTTIQLASKCVSHTSSLITFFHHFILVPRENDPVLAQKKYCFYRITAADARAHAVLDLTGREANQP